MLKLGLSATVFVSALRENQRSSIWLKACTGPILYRVSMSRLIASGHLMRPRVLFYRFQHDASGAGWSWHAVARDCLARNRRRNGMIASIAERHVQQGRRVLIDTGRHDQMKLLRDMLLNRHVATEIVHGGTPPDARWDIIRRFQARELTCLIGTVFGEGVDIPELEVVINAEGQKSQKAAIQRMRNLTPCEGKGEVTFIDFADLGQPFLQRQSLERLRLYRGMRGFSVEVVFNPTGPRQLPLDGVS
jgi:superfamily II DNA or RNA helicase